MEIWLVRHGQTAENREKLIQGHQEGKLSEIGISQAKSTGVRLAKETFDHIYSSDLGRTRETLKYIVSFRKDSPSTTFTPLLREKSGGILEGKSASLWESKALQAKMDIRKFRCENSESWDDVMVRAELFLKFLINKYIRKREVTITEQERKAGFIPLSIQEPKLLTEPYEENKLEEEKVQKLDSLKPVRKEVIRSSSCRRQRPKIFENEVSGIISKGRSDGVKKILVVTHGGFIMELFNVIAKKLLDEQPKLQNDTPNCSITILRFSVVKNVMETKLKLELVKRNDVSHLKAMFTERPCK